jgi:hypothetical protein
MTESESRSWAVYMILLITYDLHKPDRDYPAVEKVIRAETSIHIEESVWLVDTVRSPADWRDRLKETASEATYFVVCLQKPWASSGMDKDAVAWLKDTSRRW